MAELKYVNLGCGSRYHPDWINFDISPSDPNIIAADLSRGIPLPDDDCDVVYHSHLLEHLRPPQALRFLLECRRVLKPGGVLRVAIPDLEQICLTYLRKLDAAAKGDEDAARDYDWMLIEMYDQTVREQSGGLMLGYLSQAEIPNESFIYERIGEEAKTIIKSLRAEKSNRSNSQPPPDEQVSFISRVRNLRTLPRRVRQRLLQRWLGTDGLQALQVGRFRLAGEVHQWMYDRYSLSRLMLSAGFQDPIQQTATSSQIAGWSTFNLDTAADGTVIKPDSLFMEARRPV